MKNLFALFFALVLCCSVAGQNGPARLSDLIWLAGCWETRNPVKGSVLSEQWMKPEGGVMLGMGRTIEDRKAVDWEFMSIEQEGNSLTFYARPRSNADSTAFKLIRIGRSEIVFENPAHDFPQRIMYKREGEKMTARIEGTKEGKTRGVDFSYNRVPCD